MTIFDEEQAAARKEQKQNQARMREIAIATEDAVKNLYATRHGRLYLRWLLEISGAFGVSAYHKDPYDTARACGAQEVGFRIMDHMLGVDSEAFANMMKEGANERRDARSDTGDDGTYELPFDGADPRGDDDRGADPSRDTYN